MRPINEVLSAVDAFDAAFRARDLVAAQAVWAMDQPDVVIFGSGPGEDFFGPEAVQTCFATVMSRTTTHGWRWVDRRVSIVGDIAWLVAIAPWQTVQPDGTVSERPYRVTGVLVRGEGGWRWRQYHGSEPIGSIG